VTTGRISLAAVDLGASSGRVMLGRFDPGGPASGRLELTEVRRFRNGPVSLPDGLYWDILGLYTDVLTGLRETTAGVDDLVGVGIDSWAVDYGLVRPDGQLIGNPRHYRDPRTSTAVIESVHRKVSPAELYAVTGLQHLAFNSVYQLATEPDLAGVQALLIPDLLGYWLTGNRITEATNASTTGLLDATTGDWSGHLRTALGLPADLFPPVVAPGTPIGPLRSRVLDDAGITRPLTLTTVGSHDTASAVLGVPAATENFAYISCGTWGLVGVELDRPILSDAARAANFTNERGVDGTIRFLRNAMGLWVLSETLRTWGLHDQAAALPDLLDRAGQQRSGGPVVDLDAPEFLPPGDMPARITAACQATDQPPPATRPAMVRCILDSLARTFAATIEEAQRLSGRTVDVIHVVGGGARMPLLCRLLAEDAHLPVIAGPVEATALGNLLVQARTHDVLPGDRWALRMQLRAATNVLRYEPGRSAGRT
jgi:rhamnulokinase